MYFGISDAANPLTQPLRQAFMGTHNDATIQKNSESKKHLIYYFIPIKE